jgi:hypothetical protein
MLVYRDQRQALNLCLRDEQAVKRVVVMRRQAGDGKRVRHRYVEFVKASACNSCGNIDGRAVGSRSLPMAYLIAISNRKPSINKVRCRHPQERFVSPQRRAPARFRASGTRACRLGAADYSLPSNA